MAFESHPKFIQIHQWNEFAGQTEGQGAGPAHDIYGDEYNLEFSDDIEPTKSDQCAYRGCGGWGFYYMNLTKAILSLYEEVTPDITIMALSAPYQPVVKEKEFPLDWETLGNNPQVLYPGGGWARGCRQAFREQLYAVTLRHSAREAPHDPDRAGCAYVTLIFRLPNSPRAPGSRCR